MKVAYVLLCDRAEVLNGKIYTMGAGWNAIQIAELQKNIELFVAIGIDIDPQELESEYDLKVEVVDPDGKATQPEFDAHFAFPDIETRPGQTQRLNVAIKSSPMITTVGPHAVIVSIDGAEFGRARFYVNEIV